MHDCGGGVAIDATLFLFGEKKQKGCQNERRIVDGNPK